MYQPVIVERTFPFAAAIIWKALTDKSEMKKWYFDLQEFKAEVGFAFQFSAGGKDPNQQFLHLCTITAVVPEKKLAYSWRYDGYPGDSLVTFELLEEGNSQTRLRVTHSGLETFPQTPELARNNFLEGWTHIINIGLKEYLDELSQRM